jgi:site-specific DNA-methyltransferase (adenine-specific)
MSAADSGGVPGAMVELPAVLPPAPRTFGDGAIELRVGRWQEALADVASVDVLITDPPYSERTHAGHNDGRFAKLNGVERRALGYECWTADDVAAFVAAWAPRTRGWFVAITDHVLSPAWEAAFEAADRYVFAPLQFMASGSRVRIGGDGPALWSTTIVVARPRNRSFQQWGSLPGGYVLPSGAMDSHNGRPHTRVIGGKPLWLMQALIRDYSRPGDLICDPCAGGATTLLAAAIEGRRGIGAEMDPATYALACKRLGRGYTPNMFTPARAERAPATQHDLDLGTITTTR